MESSGTHPLRKLKQQSFDDFEKEFTRYDKPCVQLVDKRKKPELVQPVEPPQPIRLNLIHPIKERDIVATII